MLTVRPIDINTDVAAADTEQELYKALDVTLAIIKVLRICNRTAGVVTFRLSKDQGDDNTVESTGADAIYWDTEIPANDSFTVHHLVCAPGTSINLRASDTDVAVSIDGLEFV